MVLQKRIYYLRKLASRLQLESRHPSGEIAISRATPGGNLTFERQKAEME